MSPSPEPTAAIDPRLLPPQLRALVGALGPAATLRLLRRYGGQRVHIAQDPAQCVALAEVLEPAEIAAVCGLWGGTRPQLPKWDKVSAQLRDAAIRADARTNREIARSHQITVRWVQMVRGRGPRGDTRQQELAL